MAESQGQPRGLSPGLRRRLLWTAAGLFLVCGVIDWWLDQQKEHRYDSAIVQVARQAQIDPALVKAVVWRESRFNPKVRGRVGEIGLMQIRSLTADEWAQNAMRQHTFDGNLFEPEVNLRIGTWYLAKLTKRYTRTDNPIPYALADYNAGRGNVLRWIKGTAETNSAAFIEQITYPGTQDYVRAIMRRATKYEHSFPPPAKETTAAPPK